MVGTPPSATNRAGPPTSTHSRATTRAGQFRSKAGHYGGMGCPELDRVAEQHGLQGTYRSAGLDPDLTIDSVSALHAWAAPVLSGKYELVAPSVRCAGTTTTVTP